MISHHHDQNYDIYLETKLHYALISWPVRRGGGWVIPGAPGHLHNDVYKSPVPKTKIV